MYKYITAFLDAYHTIWYILETAIIKNVLDNIHWSTFPNEYINCLKRGKQGYQKYTLKYRIVSYRI